MVVVSDGGPDHHITFVSVKVAMLVLFQALDLDMLVCVRTFPYRNCQNIAERMMSTLNLALMNVSLARLPLTDEGIEKLVYSKKTLTELRDLFSQKPEIHTLFCDAMQAPLCTVASRLSQMEIKGEAVTTIASATDDEISEHFECIHSIEPGLSSTHLNKESLEKAPGLKTFIETHCFCSKYLFQIKNVLIYLVTTAHSIQFACQQVILILFHLYLYLFMLQFQTKASMHSSVTYLVNPR